MALWCQGFPVVTIPQGEVPKPFTLVLPYFENPRFLATQLGWWSTYPDHVKAHVRVIIADDCTADPEKRAERVLKGKALPLPIRLFYIEQKKRWNWLAARNIGAHHAENGWLLLTDIDHVLPANTAAALIYGQHDPSKVYAFSRIEHTGEVVNPHSASFFMTRKLFWKIGGYDERLSGWYGTDGLYRKRLATHANIHVLRDRLVRHEYQADSSTVSYGRKEPRDAKKPTLTGPHRVLGFPYREVALA